MRNIKKIQEEIIKEMKSDNSKKGNFINSIYFCPSQGFFIHNDRWIDEEIIKPLFDNQIIEFHSFSKHQGEIMIRYVLK